MSFNRNTNFSTSGNQNFNVSHTVSNKNGTFGNVSHSTVCAPGNKPSHSTSATIGKNFNSGNFRGGVSHSVTASTRSKPVGTTSANISHTSKNGGVSATKSLSVSRSTNGNHSVDASVNLRF
jgi:hypothetical protein